MCYFEKKYFISIFSSICFSGDTVKSTIHFGMSVICLADATLKCTFERFEKCFFDNIQEVDDFQWGLGFVSYLFI